jgi:hypothetical protein
LLNEFVVLERGLAAAGFSITPRHADVQSPGSMSDAVHVRLDGNGMPIEVSLLKSDRVASLWTLRNGKHNSFPYVQLKEPLLSVPTSSSWHKELIDVWKPLSLVDRRRKLHELTNEHPVASEQPNAWPVASLKARRESLGQDGPLGLGVVAAAIDRFLKASEHRKDFFTRLANLFLKAADEGDVEIVEIARVSLCGRKSNSDNEVVGAPLYFDVARGEFELDVASSKHICSLSQALRDHGQMSARFGVCALIGENSRLHYGNFPQPNLPSVGQIYLFAKNEDIPAAHRYDRFAEDAIPVGLDLMHRLAGALDEITAEHRKGQTWRSVPGRPCGSTMARAIRLRSRTSIRTISTWSDPAS